MKDYFIKIDREGEDYQVAVYDFGNHLASWVYITPTELESNKGSQVMELLLLKIENCKKTLEDRCSSTT